VSWEFNYLLNWPFLPLSLFILRKGHPIRKHFLLIGKDGMSLVKWKNEPMVQLAGGMDIEPFSLSLFNGTGGSVWMKAQSL
jgi:hypothetical protein